MPATVTLQHYEVLTREDGSLHELGRGAMGITYKGIDTRLRVPVALKVINSTHLHSESARQRFVREARSAAQLRHRNVASVFHLGEEGGNYFYAMEFIDGETVEALVRRQGALTLALALRITAQVARALNAAQMQDLVHRDIKPANLMVVWEDDDLVVKVIDFGLAKVVLGDRESGAESLTHGGFLGTPHFASPEQLEEREIDVRSDIYSLGVTLWYLLRGTTPFNGSVARVVGQHLSKPPPLEELAAFPEMVVELLRKMLAKDPAERPQSPADLRQEIEHCLQALIGAGKIAPGRPGTASPASTTGQTTAAPDDLRLEAGATIAGRYQITHELGENEAGVSFRARDLQEDREVRLLALHRELVADTDTFAQIERETGALTALAHPQVLEVFGLTTVGRATFLTLGWTDGFSLRELLRTRRELPPAEVRRLLEPAAAGLDHAAALLPRLELGLHHVLIHFPGRERPVEELLAQAVPEWPDFVVKINPLATLREIFALNWAAGQTLVGGGHQERKSAPGRAGAIQAFGAIAYELLGGVSAGAGTRDYTPLAALDEAGNAVLHRALFTPDSFASAEEFIRQFAEPPAVEMASAVRARPQPIDLSPPVERALETTSPTEHPTLVLPPEDPLPVLPRRRSLFVPIAVLLAAVSAGYGIHRLRHQPRPPLLTQATPAPTILPQTPAPAATPPTVRPATPRPSTPFPSTPPPPPTRRDLASEARRAAETLEAKQQSREALTAWLRMARDFPEFDSGRLGVELLLGRLSRRPGGFSRAEFAAMQPEIRQAAQMGVLAAMMTLGEELRESEPTQSFAWYCAAAAGGDPLAMTQAGLMLSNGAGTPRDLRKAVAFFQAATGKNEPGAMAVLAECYLDGKGVAEDKKHALTLLQKASEKGNARARNRLGLCYHTGIAVARNDREAFRLFSEATELGSVEAIGNLGVLYMKGEGVAKNEAKAAERFKEASLKGDTNGMYYYASCLENGLGVKASETAAKTWFQKAAAAGHSGAMEWCKSKGVPGTPPR